MKHFQIQFRVRYAETDAMGVVHHAVYPVGIPYSEMESRGLQSPVVAIHVRYLKPARYDDLITLFVQVARYTGVRLTIKYRVNLGDELLCTGESEHAFLCHGRPTALQKSYPDIHDLLLRSADQGDEDQGDD
jgi:acyl-CoA thioester hydrolase